MAWLHRMGEIPGEESSSGGNTLEILVRRCEKAHVTAQPSWLIKLVYKPPEFQLTPLPDTNPVLEGVRWKQYHAALGSTLEKVPEESWDIVKKEKSADMIHLLDFPYNGEPPRVSCASRSLLFASDFDTIRTA